MLVLSRKTTEGENTVIITVKGIKIRVVLLANDRGKFKLGFDAPEEVEIWREELLEDASDLKW